MAEVVTTGAVVSVNRQAEHRRSVLSRQAVYSGVLVGSREPARGPILFTGYVRTLPVTRLTQAQRALVWVKGALIRIGRLTSSSPQPSPPGLYRQGRPLTSDPEMPHEDGIAGECCGNR
jgi:hypothetical protein